MQVQVHTKLELCYLTTQPVDPRPYTQQKGAGFEAMLPYARSIFLHVSMLLHNEATRNIIVNSLTQCMNILAMLFLLVLCLL